MPEDKAAPDDPFRVLGIPLTFDAEAIRSAYLQAVRQHPPESDPEAFKQIQRSYELLNREDLVDFVLRRYAILPPDVPTAEEALASGPLTAPLRLEDLRKLLIEACLAAEEEGTGG